MDAAAEAAAHHREVDLLSQALLREYMNRRGFKRTLAIFDEEQPRDASTISSRAIMAKTLRIDKIVQKNKESEYPLATILELLVSHVMTRSKSSDSPAAAPSATPAVEKDQKKQKEVSPPSVISPSSSGLSSLSSAPSLLPAKLQSSHQSSAPSKSVSFASDSAQKSSSSAYASISSSALAAPAAIDVIEDVERLLAASSSAAVPASASPMASISSASITSISSSSFSSDSAPKGKVGFNPAFFAKLAAEEAASSSSKDGDYSFTKRNGERLVKGPGSIQGNQFSLSELKNCEIYLMDVSSQVTLDFCEGCRIIIGPVDGSVFARDCKNCVFELACRQFRSRDCSECVLGMYVGTDPIIETSHHLKFRPWSITYKGIEEQFKKASLDISDNKWKRIYDFNQHDTSVPKPRYELFEHVEYTVIKTIELPIAGPLVSKPVSPMDFQLRSNSIPAPTPAVSALPESSGGSFSSKLLANAAAKSRLTPLGKPSSVSSSFDFKPSLSPLVDESLPVSSSLSSLSLSAANGIQRPSSAPSVPSSSSIPSSSSFSSASSSNSNPQPKSVVSRAVDQEVEEEELSLPSSSYSVSSSQKQNSIPAKPKSAFGFEPEKEEQQQPKSSAFAPRKAGWDDLDVAPAASRFASSGSSSAFSVRKFASDDEENSKSNSSKPQPSAATRPMPASSSKKPVADEILDMEDLEEEDLSSPSSAAVPASSSSMWQNPKSSSLSAPTPAAAAVPSKGHWNAASESLGLENGRKLRKLLVGSGRRFMDNWKRQGFSFVTLDNLKYGLHQRDGGPCGVLAAVQAFFLVDLLHKFNPADTHGFPNPSVQTQTNSLVHALTHIIWDVCGEGKIGRLALGGVPSDSSSGDIQIENMRVYTAASRKDLSALITGNLKQLQDPEGCGVVQLLASACLTRGIDRVSADMDIPGQTLIVEHGQCCQELVNLLVCGVACSNVFDGNKVFNDDDGGSGDSHTAHGIPFRCQVGLFSLFEKFGYCVVGEHLKTPHCPVWIVCSESHYTVMFEADGKKSLLPDSEQFDLLWFDGLGRQDEEIRLTIDLRQKTPIVHKDSELIPPLEDCIRTKWPAARVNWNGSTPLL